MKERMRPTHTKHKEEVAPLSILTRLAGRRFRQFVFALMTAASSAGALEPTIAQANQVSAPVESRDAQRDRVSAQKENVLGLYTMLTKAFPDDPQRGQESTLLIEGLSWLNQRLKGKPLHREANIDALKVEQEKMLAVLPFFVVAARDNPNFAKFMDGFFARSENAWFKSEWEKMRSRKVTDNPAYPGVTIDSDAKLLNIAKVLSTGTIEYIATEFGAYRRALAQKNTNKAQEVLAHVALWLKGSSAARVIDKTGLDTGYSGSNLLKQLTETVQQTRVQGTEPLSNRAHVHQEWTKHRAKVATGIKEEIGKKAHAAEERLQAGVPVQAVEILEKDEIFASARKNIARVTYITAKLMDDPRFKKGGVSDQAFVDWFKKPIGGEGSVTNAELIREALAEAADIVFHNSSDPTLAHLDTQRDGNAIKSIKNPQELVGVLGLKRGEESQRMVSFINVIISHLTQELEKNKNVDESYVQKLQAILEKVYDVAAQLPLLGTSDVGQVDETIKSANDAGRTAYLHAIGERDPGKKIQLEGLHASEQSWKGLIAAVGKLKKIEEFRQPAVEDSFKEASQEDINTIITLLAKPAFWEQITRSKKLTDLAKDSPRIAGALKELREIATILTQASQMEQAKRSGMTDPRALELATKKYSLTEESLRKLLTAENLQAALETYLVRPTQSQEIARRLMNYPDKDMLLLIIGWGAQAIPEAQGQETAKVLDSLGRITSGVVTKATETVFNRLYNALERMKGNSGK